MPAPYAPPRAARLSDASSDDDDLVRHDPALANLAKAAVLSAPANPPAPARAFSLSPISSYCDSAISQTRLSTSPSASSTSSEEDSASASASASASSTPARTPHNRPLLTKSASTATAIAFTAAAASLPNPSAHARNSLPKTVSSLQLEIPRGRVECIPRPPRPETPRQLPRPRVFIKQPSGKSTNDTDFERFMSRDDDESDAGSQPTTITPSNSASSAQSVVRQSSGWERSPEKTVTQLLQEDDDFYFSDDESLAGVRDLPKNFIKKDPFASVMQSDALSSKVHRVLSNIRSISFQNPAVEDPDTAWGQTAHEFSLRKKSTKSASSASRWRRPRGRISSKNGVQEFECYSEADAASMHSYVSARTGSGRRDRAYNHRDAIRGLQGLTSRRRNNLWSTSPKRDRAPPMAPNFLVGAGQDYLAAATTLNEPLHTVTAVVPAEPESQERRRGSVDKYVEFIHASAQRESKNKMLSRNFTGRVLHRAQGLFRRKWKV